MDPKYSIVKYTPEFKNQVVELQKHLWSPSTALNTAFFEWKYERNPYTDTPLVYLVLCGEEVVAMRGMFGVRWKIGPAPDTFLGLCGEDLVVAPDHRNRGLVTKIMKFALNDLGKRGYSHIFNMSATPVTFFSSLAMGWRTAGSLKPVHWHPAQVPFLQRLRMFIVKHQLLESERYPDRFPFRQWMEWNRPLNCLDRKRSRNRFPVSPFISVQQAPRPEAMAELVEKIGNDGRIRPVKDRTYFAWRFQNPLSGYRFLFRENAGLEGYLVLQDYVSRRMDKTRINIVDWEATNSGVFAELLRTAISMCDFGKMVTWSATADDETMSLLRKAGFHSVEESKGVAQHQLSLLVKPVRDDVRDGDWAIGDVSLLDLANWDVRMVFSTIG